MGKTETTSESSGEAKKKKKMIETTPAPSTGNSSYFGDITPNRSPAKSYRMESSAGDAPTGASRGAPANLAEERNEIRAPGQRSAAAVAQDRRVRPKEPGGNADRSPVKTAAQSSYDSIQELRGRLDNTLPGLLGGMSRLNLNNQIKQLQQGGTPVMSGTMTVGVVSKGGTYSGRPEYSDFAMSSFRKNRKTGMPPVLRTPIGNRGRSPDPDRGNNTATTPAVTPVRSIQQTGLMGSDDVAARARRAQISGGAGFAARRQFLKGI